MKEDFTENSQSVQSHLTMIQNVIQRMASNSSSSKTWCITLVSAILVIQPDDSMPEYMWITLIPMILFMILDAYYLALEKGFRESYNQFIKKLHKGKLDFDDMFVVKPTGFIFILFLKSLCSFSIWPFYGLILSMVVLINKIVWIS